jgi:uncharacterized integral membrane protein
MRLFGTGEGAVAAGGTGHGDPQSERERARNTLDQQLKQIEWLAWNYFLVVAISILLYALAESWRRGRLEVLVFDAGVLLGLTVTSAAIGGLLGFLFGIPRSLQGAGRNGGEGSSSEGAGGEAARGQPRGSGSAAATGRAFAGNSNLEEISDWLTKIIVGVGLVQATAIYDKLMALASWFQQAVPESHGAQAMFVIVFLSSIVGGFLFLYLETRTRVMKLFTDTETAISPLLALQEPAIRTALQMPIGVRGQRATLSQEDEELLKIPYESLSTGAQLAAWGSA